MLFHGKKISMPLCMGNDFDEKKKHAHFTMLLNNQPGPSITQLPPSRLSPKAILFCKWEPPVFRKVLCHRINPQHESSLTVALSLMTNEGLLRYWNMFFSYCAKQNLRWVKAAVKDIGIDQHLHKENCWWSTQDDLPSKVNWSNFCPHSST